MLVGIFKETALHGTSANHYPVMEAFYKGVSKYHNDVFYHEGFEYKECDVAIILGSWKDRPKRTHHVLKNEINKKHNGRIIIIETPLLGRTTETQHIYWRVGLNHYMYGLADFGFVDTPSPDRWEKLLRDPRVDVNLKPWKEDGDFVLLALQLPGDASLMGTDHYEWAHRTAKRLKKISNKPIKIRPHPLSKIKIMDLWAGPKFFANCDFIDTRITNTSIYDDIEKASCLVTFSSGSAIDAILSGTPVVALHDGCLAYPLSGHTLAEVNNPPKPDRMSHLYNLAYAQWSVEEMEEGLPWLHLKERL